MKNNTGNANFHQNELNDWSSEKINQFSVDGIESKADNRQKLQLSKNFLKNLRYWNAEHDPSEKHIIHW